MKFDMAGISVMLAMPTHRGLSPLTVRSLLETQHLCIQRGIPISIEMQAGSSLVHHARTKAAHGFLKSDRTRLFWVDSDMVWTGADFLRLLALSTVMDCVCGAYPAKADPPRFFLNVADPTAAVEANEYGCLPVNGAGLGFTVVARHVIEQLAAKAPLLKFPDIPEGPIPHIFRCDDSGGEARGEDMAFFADVRALGYPVFLDPSIVLGHVGEKEYRAALFDHIERVPASPTTNKAITPARTGQS